MISLFPHIALKPQLISNIVLNQRDPTQTTVLRQAFVMDFNRRFNALVRLINEAIIRDDVFGLRNDQITGTLLNKKVVVNQSPGRRAFDFPKSSDKVAAFMRWFRRQVENELLTVVDLERVGDSVNAAWTNVYIESGYKSGITSARAQLARGFDVPSLESTGGIGASLASPLHVDRLGLLFTRTFNELKGITDAMDQQISRILTQGIADGISPRILARRLVATIQGGGADLGLTDTLGRFIPAKRRAQILARTEIIRAHADATLQEFATWGIQGVKLKVEWITAGDNRVCARCADLEGSVFTLAEAAGKIPLHAQCRCAWIPVPV